jgi:hypothetical protein
MSTASQRLSPEASEAEEGKPLRYIIQNLERAYGVPENCWTDWDPLAMLVATVLSQATSDVNSDRTWEAPAASPTRRPASSATYSPR